MSIRFILTIPVLFVSAFFGGMVLAASTQGSCPSGSMNATQYSSSPRTTSGQLFLPDGLTAAHKKLPFGTRVKVTNPLTGTVVKAFVPIAPSALSSDCSVPGVHNQNILSAMGF
jgi:hypothetical protein